MTGPVHSERPRNTSPNAKTNQNQNQRPPKQQQKVQSEKNRG